MLGVVVYILATLFFHRTEAAMTLTSIPLSIKSANESLMLTCAYNTGGNTTITNLKALTLLRRDSCHWMPILSVTGTHPMDVTIIDTLLDSSIGFINASGPSFLQATYNQAGDDRSGLYRCDGFGLNADKRKRNVQATLNVKFEDANANKSDAQTEELQMCKEKLTSLENKLNDTIEQLEQCHDQLNTTGKEVKDKVPRSADNALIERKMDRVAEDKDVVLVTPIYDSNSFYFFSRKMMTFDEGKELCEKYDGYLAEINSEKELDFVTTHCSYLVYGNYLLGAKYDSYDADFQFVTHPEDRVYTGHWMDGEPNRASMERNWLLIRYCGQDLKMLDGIREHEYKIGYLCEYNWNKDQERQKNEEPTQ